MLEITREELDDAAAGETVLTRFLATVDAHPQQVALRAKQADDSYQEWTYAEYAARVAASAAYLRGLGVTAGDRVVLMMRNIPDFHFIDLGITALGGTAISIYNSSSPDQVEYLVGHCKAKVAIVENDSFEERFTKVRDRLPQLETIVNLAHPGVTDEIYATAPLDLAAETKNATPESLVTVIYTSGTTGPPKGVMLTHRNVVWTAFGYLRMLDVDPVGFRAISYLPMAHIAERMSTHYLAIMGGYEVTTCPDPGQIAAYAREVHPQIMFGVPRV